MPRIFDNIEQRLLPALVETLEVSDRADFCVGYFNLRGWKELDSYIEQWSGGEGHCCRLLVGMAKLPEAEVRDALGLGSRSEGLDNATLNRLKKALAEEFRKQLATGIPTDEDEIGLRRLAAQIRSKKVIVKLFCGHLLHAKLYLLFRPDPITPTVGYMGSSNLTFAGLAKQGELNIDVTDQDACRKLARWFDDRWSDRWCLDISDELAQIIEESWARVDLIPPYHIYLKIAYHLAEEAREGLTGFQIPHEFGNKLFEFQKAAVKIAAHHIDKRGGVLLGDVVGLGKTLMATTVAKILQEQRHLDTLIICPKHLVPMWEDYRRRYRMIADVVPLSKVIQDLPDINKIYDVVLIDESHNLRNREGKRYKVIQEYIHKNECKCILVSATPYNKTYLDLSNQLRLFVPEDKDIGVRPEQFLKQENATELISQTQVKVRSLAAFELSGHADDWRDLMRLYLVRRTRSFIQDNSAKTDEETGRKYLEFEDGTKSYFPTRIPKTAKFDIDEGSRDDQYGRLYSQEVVATIDGLNVPRYGLGKKEYRAPSPFPPPSEPETKAMEDLSRAGKRLMGFCKTNLFKRLESGGYAFIQSLERHILRNFVYLHAIETKQPLPIGTQDVAALDSRVYDADIDAVEAGADVFEEEENGPSAETVEMMCLRNADEFKSRAEGVYDDYKKHYEKRFKWLRPGLFGSALKVDLEEDSVALMAILQTSGHWLPTKDAKLDVLADLLTRKHPSEKVIVFTQFADTVRYLEKQLRERGVSKLAGVTGDAEDPTRLAWRFSPVSNEKRDSIRPEEELRVLIATDVLSEGQNLQDCAVVVNYDLPWAIIRLVQRVGRVDRIGQRASQILCYSFLPAKGVDDIIKLRSRVRQRLKENAEVVGTDEAFFEDDHDDNKVRDLYSEKAGILDGEADDEVDLASRAYQIWKNAIDANPGLRSVIENLPPVVFSTRPHVPSATTPEGVLVYLRTADDNDALAWLDRDGNTVTESQLAILKAAECAPDTPALPRLANHHRLVHKATELILKEVKRTGGQLGRPSSARYRVYERLKKYALDLKGTQFESDLLNKAIQEIYSYQLHSGAKETINRQLRGGVSDADLAQLVINLYEDRRLCRVDEPTDREPQIICSMGLSAESRAGEE